MSRTKKSVWLIVSALLVALLIISACGGAANPIVGKWADPTGQYTFEFKADGKLGMSAAGVSIDAGTYKIIDASHMEMEIMGQKQALTYSISGDKLTMTDESGAAIELVRQP